MNTEIRELDGYEIDAVSGGPIPLAVAVAIVVASVGAGYTVGSDMARRDNANDQQQSCSG